MYSAARVNQLDMEDTFFEFVINVSQQGNNGEKMTAHHNFV